MLGMVGFLGGVVNCERSLEWVPSRLMVELLSIDWLRVIDLFRSGVSYLLLSARQECMCYLSACEIISSLRSPKSSQQDVFSLAYSQKVLVCECRLEEAGCSEAGPETVEGVLVE